MTDPQFEDQPPAAEPERIYWGDGRPGLASFGAIALIAIGALGVLYTLFAFSQLHAAAQEGLEVDGVEYGIWFVQLAFSVVQIISGIFLWRGREWARVLGLVFCWLNLVGGIITLFTGAIVPAFIGLAINGGVIAALTRPDVRDWAQEQRLAHRNG